MANVTFIRGLRSNYDGTGAHVDGIYFATDTLEILMNDKSYGAGVVNVTLEDNVMTFTAADGTTSTITFPYATDSAGGWMTAEDKAKLDALADDISTAIEEALAELNYSDGIESGRFVTSVSETAGVISVTKGSVTSEDGSVTIVPSDGGDIDLSVNYPDETLYAGTEAINVADYVVSLTIDSDDVVLSQSDSGLKTTLKLEYDSDSHYIKLLGIDGAEVTSFDATEFVVDGMIEDVELVHENPETGETGEFIEITWNIEGGQQKTIYLDVTELIDVYTAGNGIDITDNEVSVKLADSTEEFLTVDESGLKLSGVQDAIDAAKAELEEEIEEAAAASKTEVAVDPDSTHITVATSTGTDGQTIYTLGDTDVASDEEFQAYQVTVNQEIEDLDKELTWIDVD